MNNLRKERQHAGFSLAQLSHALLDYDVKIGSDSLGKYERGDREPKLKTWEKLAELYGVSVEYLMGFSAVRTLTGQRIKQLRQERNLTITGLSKELKKDGVAISPSSIMKYERGEREPKIDKIRSLAAFFNVAPNYLEQNIDDLSLVSPSVNTNLLVTQLTEKVEKQSSEVIELYNALQEELAMLRLLSLEMKEE